MIFPGICKYQDQLVPTCWAGIFLAFFFSPLLFAFQCWICARQTRHRACAGTRGGWYPVHGTARSLPAPQPPHSRCEHLALIPLPSPREAPNFTFIAAGGVPPRASVGHTRWNNGQELITQHSSSPSLWPDELGKEGRKAEAACPLSQLLSAAWQLWLEGCSQNS